MIVLFEPSKSTQKMGRRPPERNTYVWIVGMPLAFYMNFALATSQVNMQVATTNVI